MSRSHRPLPLILLPLLLAVDQGHTQTLYRWVDDQGEIHYTDQLPPEHAGKARARLSEEGIAVEFKPKEPSPEERERAKELERQRAEEERRKAERLAEDRRLVQTYRTLEDLDLARNGQIAIIEAIIQVKRDQIRTLTHTLLRLDGERQSFQAINQPLPPALSEQIASNLARLHTLYGEVLNEEWRKIGVWEDFARKRARYLELKKQPAPKADDSFTAELAMLSCDETAQCHDYWRKALIYARAPLTEGERQELIAPGLAILLQRTKEEERLIHLVWIQKSSDQPVWIYLDLQCRNRQTGNLTCADPKIARLRQGFRLAVTRP
ncbi:DUF4124 domain-containing protein [Caldichromatium japonicum]|uniref:DUF4124 domain-containing protein n=1 Tax=Caldichromatium japonicum TaxID=2699430 RepID=A0A6G7V9W4_9GAMM|nr:DUF4124 domain-containing protein [Caldichromatium japonicum]QIK36811.1 DUF4124 domain-containing protein [Caldichromatium japonicum]